MRVHRFAAWLLLGPVGAGWAAPAERAAILTTPHFAVFSDFETNLNDALIVAGLARRGKKAEPFPSADEAACLDRLAPEVRAGWDGAVDYYAKIVSAGRFTDREQFAIRMRLAGLEEFQDAGSQEFLEIARHFRAVATPAYMGCRWAAQDEKNRAWIEELKTQLTAHEAAVARRLETLYQKPWDGLPMPVDVVETVSWSGANSIILDSGGGHLLLSSQNPTRNALELVFHEASHVLMDRGDPVQKALDQAAAAAGLRRPPPDLWHVVLFYTTGEAVRRVLFDAKDVEYTPMLEEIYARGGWVEYRPAVEKEWRPYLDGRRSLAASAEALIAALQRPAAPGE